MTMLNEAPRPDQAYVSGGLAPHNLYLGNKQK
jgi:hypothetical protein